MTAVELKFNCFFLMPLIDTFPTRLREELEAAYEEDLDEVTPYPLMVPNALLSTAGRLPYQGDCRERQHVARIPI